MTSGTSGRKRAGVVAGAVGALVATFAAGSVWGGREKPPPEVVAAPPGQVHPVSGALRPAASCDDLLAWYVENSLDLVGPYGWLSDSPIVYGAAERDWFSGLGDTAMDAASGAPAELLPPGRPLPRR